MLLLLVVDTGSYGRTILHCQRMVFTLDCVFSCEKYAHVGDDEMVSHVVGEEVLPHRVGVVNRHGEQDRQGFMVAFFKSLEPLSRKVAEIQTPLNVKTRSKRSTKRYQEEYWDTPSGESHTISR